MASSPPPIRRGKSAENQPMFERTMEFDVREMLELSLQLPTYGLVNFNVLKLILELLLRRTGLLDRVVTVTPTEMTFQDGWPIGPDTFPGGDGPEPWEEDSNGSETSQNEPDKTPSPPVSPSNLSAPPLPPAAQPSTPTSARSSVSSPPSASQPSVPPPAQASARAHPSTKTKTSSNQFFRKRIEKFDHQFASITNRLGSLETSVKKLMGSAETQGTDGPTEKRNLAKTSTKRKKAGDETQGTSTKEEIEDPEERPNKERASKKQKHSKNITKPLDEESDESEEIEDAEERPNKERASKKQKHSRNITKPLDEESDESEEIEDAEEKPKKGRASKKQKHSRNITKPLDEESDESEEIEEPEERPNKERASKKQKHSRNITKPLDEESDESEEIEDAEERPNKERASKKQKHSRNITKESDEEEEIEDPEERPNKERASKKQKHSRNITKPLDEETEEIEDPEETPNKERASKKQKHSRNITKPLDKESDEAEEIEDPEEMPNKERASKKQKRSRKPKRSRSKHDHRKREKETSGGHERSTPLEADSVPMEEPTGSESIEERIALIEQNVGTLFDYRDKMLDTIQDHHERAEEAHKIIAMKFKQRETVESESADEEARRLLERKEKRKKRREKRKQKATTDEGDTHSEVFEATMLSPNDASSKKKRKSVSLHTEEEITDEEKSGRLSVRKKSTLSGVMGSSGGSTESRNRFFPGRLVEQSSSPSTASRAAAYNAEEDEAFRKWTKEQLDVVEELNKAMPEVNMNIAKLRRDVEFLKNDPTAKENVSELNRNIEALRRPVLSLIEEVKANDARLRIMEDVIDPSAPRNQELADTLDELKRDLISSVNLLKEASSKLPVLDEVIERTDALKAALLQKANKTQVVSKVDYYVFDTKMGELMQQDQRLKDTLNGVENTVESNRSSANDFMKTLATRQQLQRLSATVSTKFSQLLRKLEKREEEDAETPNDIGAFRRGDVPAFCLACGKKTNIKMNQAEPSLPNPPSNFNGKPSMKPFAIFDKSGGSRKLDNNVYERALVRRLVNGMPPSEVKALRYAYEEVTLHTKENTTDPLVDVLPKIARKEMYFEDPDVLPESEESRVCGGQNTVTMPHERFLPNTRYQPLFIDYDQHEELCSGFDDKVYRCSTPTDKNKGIITPGKTDGMKEKGAGDKTAEKPGQTM